MQIALLGPLAVRTASGDTLDLGGARLRVLLIRLALEPSQVVTTGRLIEALWPEQVPSDATNALQALVSRLRRALPGIDVVARPSGYQLRLDTDAVDVRRFERLAATGRTRLATDPAGALTSLREALDLWRGPALADVSGEPFAQSTIAWLDELRLTAVQDRIEAELRLGPATTLVAELESLIVAHPLREPLVGQLMRAQFALGLRGAALFTYEQARARLADQLGVDPSPELAALHTRLLRARNTATSNTTTSNTTTSNTTTSNTIGGVTIAGSTTTSTAITATTPSPAATGTAAPSPVGTSTAATAGTVSPARTSHPASAPPNNLRAELTSFVGRDRELSQVGQLLARHRLTTLTGPGGAGKTRLAVEAARRQLETVPDGVWLIELAPVTDPGEVAPTALATLGLRDTMLLNRRTAEASPEPMRRLIDALADKHLVLVLDNCEHLLAAAAALADRVLRSCPHVRIVATSREPLGIGGENLCPVEPLSLPAADASVAEAIRFAAVRLLIDRAAAVYPGFAVTDGNVTAVVRICRALDGIPLAIELAAARLRTLTPEQIAARLDNRFRLLTGGSRAALPRHRTLRAVVDWSWDLLDDEERTLCRRLAVFAGGATLEAVEQVCADPPADALDLLSALVDKSLLVIRHDPAGTRYRMLETIRAYGLDRLAEAGETDAIRAAHTGYFLTLAESAVDELYAQDQITWLNRLSAEHDNLHAALRFAAATEDASTAVRFVGALGWYWWLRGYKAEGAELAVVALAVPASAVGGEARAVALAMAALLTIDGTHNTDRAARWFGEAAQIAAGLPRPIPPVLRLVLPLYSLFQTVMVEKRPVATDFMEPAVADDDPWIGATARVMRAHLELNFGRERQRAAADFEVALGVYRQLGERWGTSFALTSLSQVLAWQGEFALAVAHTEEALALMAEIGMAEDEVQFQARLAHLRWHLGDPDSAWAALDRASRVARRVGLPEATYWVAHAEAELARWNGDLDRASERLAVAVTAARHQTASPQARAIVAATQGLLAGAYGDLTAAARHHARAVRIGLDSVDAPVIAHTLVAAADLELRAGRPERSARLLGAAVGVRGGPDRTCPDEDRLAGEARAALGATEFADAYGLGRATTLATIDDVVGPIIHAPLTPDGETSAPRAARTLPA